MRVAVIGGGAAGFFAAVRIKEVHPGASVDILEKTGKVLSKVRISGGGRCNVTNSCREISELVKAYPRGGKLLKKAFREFSTGDIIEWFEDRGVALFSESDGRVFPRSEDSRTIIDTLVREAKSLGVEIHMRHGVRRILQKEGGWAVAFSEDGEDPSNYDKVIITTGGSPRKKGFDWLEELGHSIVPPVPSLFTFNIPDPGVKELSGITVENVEVSVQGTKLRSKGSLLLTHWGMSGPAILKLSAFGARELHEMGYAFQMRINWVGEKDQNKVFEELEEMVEPNPKKLLTNLKDHGLPRRLWDALVERAGLDPEKPCGELGRKSLNKLVEALTNDVHEVNGKSTFKEEFVTCGGVDLKNIDPSTMESKICPGLYFAGEVLDIDAITGGYNFQACWTTAYLAGALR